MLENLLLVLVAWHYPDCRFNIIAIVGLCSGRTFWL